MKSLMRSDAKGGANGSTGAPGRVIKMKGDNIGV
jgi:hypothetical protein